MTRKQAIKRAIKHWEENVDKLTGNIGKKFHLNNESDNGIIIGRVHVYFDRDHCSLCEAYCDPDGNCCWDNKHDLPCPLIGCDHGSLWWKFIEAIYDQLCVKDKKVDNKMITKAQVILDRLRRAT